MDTVDRSKKASHYIILIPHREVLGELEKYRQRLFSLGLYGAYSFPLCAPIASVSRPFCLKELKELANNIRKTSMENDGKIITGTNIYQKSGLPGNTGELSFFGPELNIGKIQLIESDKLLSAFSPPLICTALVDANKDCEQVPALSFRAACIANLAIRMLEGTYLSFEWKIISPVWLPAYKKLTFSI